MNNKFRLVLLYILTILITAFSYTTAQPETEIIVYVGQSEIIDLWQPIKRVSIANPEIADATVTSPSQLVVNGLKTGKTSLILWAETEEYNRYSLVVREKVAVHQIMLRIKFLEIDKIALKELGSDFLVKNIKSKSDIMNVGMYGGEVSNPNDPLLLGSTVDFFVTIPTQNIQAIFKAMYENNDLELLAAPNLSTLEGSEATFLAGGEFPVPVVSGSLGMQMVTIIFKEYGVKLKFTPTVLDSQVINLNLEAEYSKLDFDNGVTLSGFRIPSLVTRKSTNIVQLREDQFLVLGGMLLTEDTNTISRIPLLGHIPVLGKLFSSTRFQRSETELLITVSPKIIHPQMPEPKLTGEIKNPKAKEALNENTEKAQESNQE
ncbi:pilus assembly protein N-terminal domain-containing protein [candidate division KSB1 bacterium]|nr:pilus assembly protein N-terminal domain-containing protein [candidate division KSB1 bacterium]